MKTTESALLKAIKDSLESIGHWVLRLNSGKIQTKHGTWIQLCEPGTPDLFVVNAMGFLEVKTPSGSMRPEQVLWHARAEQIGIRVAVVRSVSEAINAVNGWAKRRPAAA